MKDPDQFDELDEPVDANIRDLVRALNEVPGRTTFSSCGGHENPTGSQEPLGIFQVTFDVEPNELGFRALEIVTFATEEVENLLKHMGRPERVEITTGFLHLDIWERDGLVFELRGNVSPEHLAHEIRTTLREAQT